MNYSTSEYVLSLALILTAHWFGMWKGRRLERREQANREKAGEAK